MDRPTRRETIQCLALSAASSLRGVPCSAGERAPTRVPEIEEWPPVDVLVCGGGPAGIAAALMAARLGAKTLLVERYGRLGGMAVQAMVGPLMGDVHSAWVDGILEHLGGRRVDYEFIDLKYAELLGQAQGVSAAHPLGKDPEVKPYDIPYDCLVPERIDGLLVAGRCRAIQNDTGHRIPAFNEEPRPCERSCKPGFFFTSVTAKCVSQPSG